MVADWEKRLKELLVQAWFVNKAQNLFGVILVAATSFEQRSSNYAVLRLGVDDSFAWSRSGFLFTASRVVT